MPSLKKPFDKETDLCSAFIEAVDKRIWTCYAETGGWDILLSRNSDGFQIGVQAKLRMGIDVITQAIENWVRADGPGPDCRAVLVPTHNGAYDAVCKYLALVVLTIRLPGFGRKKPEVYPWLPDHNGRSNVRDWPEWAPAERHKLPSYVPDVAAGSPSPKTLSEWKIGAIKIAILLDKQGFLTRHDFSKMNVDHRRWLPGARGWLEIEDKTRYVRGKYFPDFRKMHPKAYPLIEADFEKWRPSSPPASVVQLKMKV